MTTLAMLSHEWDWDKKQRLHICTVCSMWAQKQETTTLYNILYPCKKEKVDAA